MTILGKKEDGEIQVDSFIHDVIYWTRDAYETAKERHSVYSNSSIVFQEVITTIDIDSLKKEGYELIHEQTTGIYDRKTIIRTPASFVEILESDTDFSVEIILKNYAN